VGEDEENIKKLLQVGPTGVGWYGVEDLGDDGCREIGVVLQILAD
jgi:hypothetical protein